MSYSIPHLYASGNHYDVGLSMGSTFKDRIRTYLDGFNSFKNEILPYTQTDAGKKVFADYQEVVTKTFPWYIDEIRGISDGCGVSFEKILAINLRVELIHLSKANECVIMNDNHKDSGKECSDFHVLNDNYHLLAHNEDSAPEVYTTGYIVSVKINSKDYNGKKSPNEEFTCYCYPGHLPGNAFGFNQKGFVFGVNAIYPKLILLNKIPRQFINRVMLSANTLEELEDIILNYPIAYGVSLNVGCCNKDKNVFKSDWNSEYKDDKQNFSCHDLSNPITWNYEIAPNPNDPNKNTVSKHCIISKSTKNSLSESEKTYYSFNYFQHFNHYNRIKMDECVVPTSKRREARASQLKPPTDLKGILDLVSDTGDAELPIFRNPSKTDDAKTVATALFDMKNSIMSVYFGKPSGGYELLIKIPI